MSITLDIPAELEHAALRIPDLNDRLASFIQHQVSLENWRKGRHSTRAVQLVQEGSKVAAEQKAAGLTRDEALAMFNEMQAQMGKALR